MHKNVLVAPLLQLTKQKPQYANEVAHGIVGKSGDLLVGCRPCSDWCVFLTAASHEWNLVVDSLSQDSRGWKGPFKCRKKPKLKAQTFGQIGACSTKHGMLQAFERGWRRESTPGSQQKDWKTVTKGQATVQGDPQIIALGLVCLFLWETPVNRTRSGNVVFAVSHYRIF